MRQDRRVHGGTPLRLTSKKQTISKPEMTKEIFIEDMHVDEVKMNSRNNIMGWNISDTKGNMCPSMSLQSEAPVHLPKWEAVQQHNLVSLAEGRVHGGSLMAMLAS